MTATIAPLKAGARVMHMRTGATLRLTQDETSGCGLVPAVYTSGLKRGTETTVPMRDVLPMDEAMLRLLLWASECAHQMDRPDLTRRCDDLRDDTLRVLEEGVTGP
jgi:hypothetical protein